MVAVHPDPEFMFMNDIHCFSPDIHSPFRIHVVRVLAAQPNNGQRVGQLRFASLSTASVMPNGGRHVRPCIRSVSPLSSPKLEPLISRRRGRFGSMLRR